MAYPESGFGIVSVLVQGIRASMRHVLSALVQNQPGVLAQVSGMFASRGFNIESLAVGETETAEFSRIIVVVKGDDRVLEQVRKQLEKIVTVVRVQDVSRFDHVERDLILIRIRATPEHRPELMSLFEIFRARVVDVTPLELLIFRSSGAVIFPNHIYSIFFFALSGVIN